MPTKSKKKRSTKNTKQKDYKCAGCGRSYTIFGYFQHLRQTSKPDCIKVRDSDSRFRWNSPPPPSTPSSSRSSTPPSTPLAVDQAAREPSAQLFDGDFFGEYDPAEFDEYDEYDGGDEDDQQDAHKERRNEDRDEDFELEELEEELEEDALCYQEEEDWEVDMDEDYAPQRMDVDPEDASGSDEDGAPDPSTTQASQHRAQDQLCTNTYVDRFPGARAGAPVHRRRQQSDYDKFDANEDNVYFPFHSRIDWEVGRWAKLRGATSTAVMELLKIKGLAELLGLSFTSARELNAIVDDGLSSGRPRFIRREIKVAGEVFEVFYRDIIQCICALYGDPEFTGLLVFTPERHYADADRTVRVYFDMHTGRWWWDTQAELEKRKPGATIIPIIISSNKTQLTVFGSKTAYPVYVTIGNLPKDIRRKPSRCGQILLAYLPIRLNIGRPPYLPTSKLEHITNKAARRRVSANFFHTCLSAILKPLITAGIHGITITSGDGIVRRGHPIFAMYIGDYPEQLLVTCCKNGTCPKCDIPADEMGDDTSSDRPLRDLIKVLDALSEVDNTAGAFNKACREAGIKPVPHPFWEGLPYVDIF
ncbi:hypothetical protein GSI_07438 [Ganoderma sinense ZZ0214-1]|uniref:C2H2-type domain-containing protein n=1 Tax=Ganoderma sinense ZZ0214-1 TaxID=1077348 RepID=A0A2G8S920_9APHY|nr:hypothetical protein GSI_07438 [Ganoderma sinense ZZ0214-1]